MTKVNEVAENENSSVKEYVNKVQEQFNEMNEDNSITLPGNYSIGNAVKSAYLKLLETKTGKSSGCKPVLEACSKTSIANSMLDMIIQGLSPAKSQCYFVAYGDKLQLMRSYMGTVAVTKRLEGIKDVKAYCIYEGDEFETEFDLETATIKITKFNPSLESIDINKIKGAFAVILGEEGILHTEVMSMAQIKASWGQGTTKGSSGAHNNFAEEMAKKTVLNRACKMFVNTSDDSDLLIGAFNSTTANEYEGDKKESESISKEIESNANSEVIDIPEEPVEEGYKESEKKVEVKKASSGTANPIEKDPGF